MNAPDRFELFELPEGVKKYVVIIFIIVTFLYL